MVQQCQLFGYRILSGLKEFNYSYIIIIGVLVFPMYISINSQQTFVFLSNNNKIENVKLNFGNFIINSENKANLNFFLAIIVLKILNLQYKSSITN